MLRETALTLVLLFAAVLGSAGTATAACDKDAPFCGEDGEIDPFMCIRGDAVDCTLSELFERDCREGFLDDAGLC